MASGRRIMDDSELEPIRVAGDGFIYNDFSGQGASGAEYNIMHTASCRHVMNSVHR